VIITAAQRIGVRIKLDKVESKDYYYLAPGLSAFVDVEIE
jgi:multidrug resistance efflux pump